MSIPPGRRPPKDTRCRLPRGDRARVIGAQASGRVRHERNAEETERRRHEVRLVRGKRNQARAQAPRPEHDEKRPGTPMPEAAAVPARASRGVQVVTSEQLPASDSVV